MTLLKQNDDQRDNQRRQKSFAAQGINEAVKEKKYPIKPYKQQLRRNKQLRDAAGREYDQAAERHVRKFFIRKQPFEKFLEKRRRHNG